MCLAGLARLPGMTTRKALGRLRDRASRSTRSRCGSRTASSAASQIEGFWAYFFGALVLGIANAIIKPILAILTLPLILFTLGFFYLLINIGMIALTAWIVPNFRVSGFWTYVGVVDDRVDRQLGRQRVHRALRPQPRPLIP